MLALKIYGVIFVSIVIQSVFRTLTLILLLNRSRREREEMLTIPVLAWIPTRAPRRLWMKVRSQDWWERVVMMEFTDAEWRENFRMKRDSFHQLCLMMERVMAPAEDTVRAPVPLHLRVAIVLYKLASCGEYRVVANQFGVHKCTVKKFVYIFCRGMVDSVISQLIKAPTLEEACATAQRFEQAHCIPQIIGCVDGTHIPVLPPSDGYRDFVNRKGWPSYVLQGVVDDKYCFWSISCRMPGSAHDANVLKHSDLFKNAHLLPKRPVHIDGKDIDFFILGDPAYPLMPWLMKGYPQSLRLTPEEESFSVYLSSARTAVEIAFGRLKSRWRILLKRSDFHFTFTPFMIATCCALHNFCEKEKEQVHPGWVEEAAALQRQFPQPVPHANTACTTDATSVRQALTTYMAARFPLRRRL